MNRILTNAKILFLGLFALSCVGIWTYQFVYAIPKKKCESGGGWFYGPKRLCGIPIEIERITGRPNPVQVPVATAEPKSVAN